MSLWRQRRLLIKLLLASIASFVIWGLFVGNPLRDYGDYNKQKRVVESTIVDSLSYMGQVDTVKDKALEETHRFDKGLVLKRFKTRSVLVKTACKELELNTGKPEKPVSFLYVRERNVSFCPIQKAASTFWKRILSAFARNNTEDSPFAVSIGKAYLDEEKYETKENEDLTKLVEHSESFVFVRHPFTRLFSGWLDKFYGTHPQFWKKFGKVMIESERNIEHVKCGHDVSFNEFVSFVSKKLLSGNYAINSHFTSSYEHCDVCNLHFKYVGKYETLKEDAKFIMEQIGTRTSSDLFDEFDDKSELDMIVDAVDWTFGQKNKIIRCMSFQCGLFRVWRRLISRGVISKKERFPYTKATQAMTLTKEDFKKDLVAAHKRSKSEDVALNREEVLAEAFQSLDKETYAKMLDAFKRDYVLFGYSVHESFQGLKVSKNPEDIYLQKCPYD